MNQKKRPLASSAVSRSQLAEDGYIKFQCHLKEGEPPNRELITDLMECREKLYALNLIGILPDGIGFGNISKRVGDREFIISGTQTGSISPLEPKHFVKVTSYDIDKNQLDCLGQIQASSESLTHAGAYDARPQIQAVAHIHSKPMWTKLLNKAPTTRPDATYGTPEMSRSVTELILSLREPGPYTIVMAGHEDGLIFCGQTFEQVFQAIKANL